MKVKISFYTKTLFYLLVAALIILGGNRSFGYEWFKTFGGSGTSEGGNSVQQTTDGGYIIAGDIYWPYPGTGHTEVYLIKTDAEGNEQWSKTFGERERNSGNSVQQTTDGGYIIVGKTNNPGSGSFAYLIKTDDSGNELWSKTFAGNYISAGTSGQQTTDGGYVLVGVMEDWGLLYPEPYLIKTDADGNELWSQFFDGYFGLNSVWQTTDGGYIAVGGVLIKTDANGNELWRKNYIEGACVQQTFDGGYIIVGQTDRVNLIKTDADGNEQWRKIYGVNGWSGSSVQQTTDGGYIFAGSTDTYHPNRDVYLIKTDADGNEQWRKTFGGSGGDSGSSVQQTTDGGFIIAGFTESYGAGEMSDVYLIYYKPDDNNLIYTPVAPCRIADTRKTGGIISASTEREFHVFGDNSTISAQGGNSAGCPAPMGEPLAVHINMVAVNPTGKGNLQAFPISAGTGAGLSVNYNAIDTNLANAGTVKTVIGTGPDIAVASNFSSAHTVIDVLGYYYPDEGLLYTPVMPCRIIDTRYTSAGIIDANTERNFRVFGSGGAIFAQGGSPDGCLSPLGEPLAAHINMVAVYPYGKGNLQAFPVGAETGAGLSVNYNILDTNLANAGTVKTNEGAGADITVASNFSSANTVIDVLGYFYPDGDLLYTPVKPCRIIDTRNTSAGIIDANTERDFRVFGSDSTISDQGGNSAGCPSPLGEPLAVHINMVAVNPTGKGNLQAFPVGAGTGAGLSVNYNAFDTNLANAGTVKTDTGSGADITVASNFSSAHTVIDVLGYYYPAP